MKWLLIYPDDPDGWASAKVLYDNLSSIAKQLNLTDSFKDSNIELIAADYISEDRVYKQAIDVLTNNKETITIIADFAFSHWERLQTIEKLSSKLILLDHHESTLDRYKKSPLTDKSIVILDTNKAACQIAYDFAHNTKQTNYPHWIDIIAKWDMWQWDWKETYIVYVAYGLKHYSELFQKPTSPLWTKFIDDPESVKYVGKVIVDSEIKTIKSLLDKCAYKVVNYNSDYQVLCVNTNIKNSIPFKFSDNDIVARCHVWAPYEVISDNTVDIRFYANPLHRAHICKDIAVKYQGGGHPGAAGCQIPLNTFTEILKSGQL